MIISNSIGSSALSLQLPTEDSQKLAESDNSVLNGNTPTEKLDSNSPLSKNEEITKFMSSSNFNTPPEDWDVEFTTFGNDVVFDTRGRSDNGTDEGLKERVGVIGNNAYVSTGDNTDAVGVLGQGATVFTGSGEDSVYVRGDNFSVNSGADADDVTVEGNNGEICLLYTSPSPRDKRQSRMPSSA